jgi:hypothetical protein
MKEKLTFEDGSVYEGNKQPHPQGVAELIPNVPAPDKSDKTNKSRQDLSCRPRCGQSEVC